MVFPLLLKTNQSWVIRTAYRIHSCQFICTHTGPSHSRFRRNMIVVENSASSTIMSQQKHDEMILFSGPNVPSCKATNLNDLAVKTLQKIRLKA